MIRKIIKTITKLLAFRGGDTNDDDEIKKKHRLSNISIPQRGGGTNDDDESKKQHRLNNISIPQQAAWVGLKQPKGFQPTINKDDDGQHQKNPLHIHLILWNVLGFALGDPHDYSSLAAINKTWNMMVSKLVPSIIFRIKRCLVPRSVITKLNMDLLTDVFDMLESRDCPLYRQDQNEQVSSIASVWPRLQPQFLLTLIRFSYAAATQRSPNNWTEDMYQIVCAFLDGFGQRTSQGMIKILEDFELDTNKAWTCFQCINSQWLAWEGTVNSVESICGYLNKYHVAHHGLQTISDCASTSLVKHLANVVEKKHVDSVQKLLDIMQSRGCSVPRELLSQSYKCIEKIRCLPLSEGRWKETLPSMEPTKIIFSQIRSSMEKTINESKQADSSVLLEDGVSIIFPDKQTRLVSAHFVESSGLLKQLHLTSGAVIYWDEVLSTAFDKAIEFYRIDAETRIPSISTPLRSRNMEELIGQEAGRLMIELEREELFRIITLSNFLDLKKLMDASCAQIANLIRGCSATEIRQIFNRQIFNIDDI